MSKCNVQPKIITTDIDGFVTRGMRAFGMQAVIVENDDNDIFRYWVVPGTELDEGTTVREGDRLGLPGRLPEMLSIGAAKLSFPKTFQLNSGGLIKIEQNFIGSDGKYYFARVCSIAILQEDESADNELCLRNEIIEQAFYKADESVICGKTVSNVTSLNGIREEEIPKGEADLSLVEWLEMKKNDGKLFYWCPYEQLLWLEVDLNNLLDRLIKRIKHRL